MSDNESNLPESSGSTVWKLVVLAVVAVSIAVGGYWVFEKYLLETFNSAWEFVKEFWLTFSFAFAWKSLLSWVAKMSFKWIVVEVPKRVFLYTLLPYILLWLLPRRWRRGVTVYFKIKLKQLGQLKITLIRGMEEIFGDHVGYALALVILIIVFGFFYFFFGLYLVLWLGFIKFPGFVIAGFTFVKRWVLSKVQIGSFAKFMFKWTGFVQEGIIGFFIRVFPGLSRWFSKKTEEQIRKEKVSKVRKWIAHRKRKERQLKLFVQANGNPLVFRQLVRERIHKDRALEEFSKHADEIPRIKVRNKKPCCEPTTSKTVN